MLQLYNRERSGNCYKARLLLALLGLEYEKIAVHRVGKGRNVLPPDFERLSPLRQLPVLVDDGRPYWGTIAILVYLARRHGFGTLDEAHAISQVALRVLEGRLSEHAWLALNRVTVADVACYSYTIFAAEGGVSLKPYPAVRAWFARIQALPNYLPPPEYDGAGGPPVE